MLYKILFYFFQDFLYIFLSFISFIFIKILVLSNFSTSTSTSISILSLVAKFQLNFCIYFSFISITENYFEKL